MSIPINYGGPAFPALYSGEQGMTLRDYFAGQALAGLCARDLRPNNCGNTHINHANVRCDEDYSRAAYKHADAMLAAREARK